jgi:uncharacterized damage-inducible protein DinB
MVRDEYFELCKHVPIDELLLKRNGGAGSIHYTFFHILDVEYSWIRGIQGKPDIQVQFESYQKIQQLIDLSAFWNVEIQEFLNKWSSGFENEFVTVPWSDGHFAKG